MSNDLHAIAAAMVADGKGILAIDESHSTCQKRFDALGIAFNEENRRRYRQLLITAPDLEKYISGFILFDETIRQQTDKGEDFVKVLQQKGILPGIKVDKGAKDLALHPGEKITEGLDGLRERLQEYHQLGAVFAKWRAVITIGSGIPSDACIQANAHALARYAALCQEAGLVPMVEPEILLEGGHSLSICQQVSERAWEALFAALKVQNVDLAGTILKTSMVLAGSEATTSSSKDIADATVESFLKVVPSQLAGIVFLSGGQSSEQSTTNLRTIHERHTDLPWPVSFSYGRGIQQPALNHWADNASDIPGAQDKLSYWARQNSLASQGKTDI